MNMMTDQRDVIWFLSVLAELGVDTQAYIRVEQKAEGMLVTLDILHPQFSETEFILQRAGFQTSMAYHWEGRWIHVSWDKANPPNVLAAIGFKPDPDQPFGGTE